MREFQTNKVDIVHKYNAEQCKSLIANKEISDTLINAYNKVCATIGTASHNANDVDILFDDTPSSCLHKAKDTDCIFVFDSDAEEADEADIDDI
jgi:hypothetical protein